MKRVLSFFLTLALLLSFMPTGLFGVVVSAEAVASGTCGGDLTWCLDGDGVLTISGYGEMTDYRTSSLQPWYSQRTSIKSVRIEDGVTTIGDRAFFECTNLASVSVPNGVTSIGELAFKFCKKLTSITIPDSVKTIDAAAFYECTSLTGITIPGSVTSIGQEAFYGCTNLSRVTIGDGVYKIGYYAFSNCTRLTSITIPNSVTDIKTDVFRGCINLSSAIIGDGVTYIDDYTFYGCTSLTNVTIGNSVKGIDSYAFKGCTSLTSITIPNRVRYISNWAFCNCRSLSSIIIPNSVTDIGTGAFDCCDRLRDIWYQGSYDEKDDMLIYSGNDYLNSAIWHYNACAGHTYDNYCDEQCNICGELRVAEHIYDDVCDISCNLCETTREAPHNYKWIIDQEGSCGGNGIKHEECTVCHIKRNENTIIAALKNHTFTDRNDTECNVCKQGFVLIQFNSNGGTSLSSIRTLPNQTTTLHTAVPTRAGYNFAGWATSKAGDVLYQPGDDFQTEQSVTLYAQWDKRCETCSGTGKTTCNSCSGVGTKEVTETCPNCNGGKYCFACCSRWTYYTGWNIIRYCGGYTLNNDSDTYYVKKLTCPYCGVVFTVPDYMANSGINKSEIDSIIVGLIAYNILLECEVCSGIGNIYSRVQCSKCDGSRQAECSACAGSGEATRTNVSAPAAPTLKSVTANTVTLKAITNGEYSIGGDVWQDSPIFENLESGREYRFYQRYAKTDTEYASYSSIALIVLVHEHTFDNACDDICNLCDNVRIVPDHTYDNACDTTCNECAYIRTVSDHVFDNNCDTVCNECSLERSVPDHIYDNACDVACNECGANRTVPDHIYDNACDTKCNECGLMRSVPDHVYDNVCDIDCNICHLIREVGPHFVGEGVPHILSNSQTYPFDLTGGWYNSTNKVHSSSSTFTLVAKHNCSIIIVYKVSSEKTYDKLVVKKNSNTLVTASGSVSETEITIALTEGDILTVTYSKDSSTHSGTDTASFRLVSDSCSINADELEADCLNAVICSGCGMTIKPVSTEHTYDNACDTTCNICDVVRSVPNHSYTLNGNHTCDVCMLSKTPVAPVIESKTNNSITLSFTDGFEYSKDGIVWQDNNIFTSLSANSTYTFYQRVKASDIALVSETSQGTSVTFKSSQAAPSAPSVSSYTDTTVTLVAVAYGEYSIDGITWQASNIFTGLSPATQYTFYQRYVESETCEASDMSGGKSITTDKTKQTQTPSAPTVESVTSSKITLSVVDGCEYSKNGTTWQSSNVFSGLSCGTEYTFYQRYKETATTYAGRSSDAIVAKTDKGTQSKPSAPTLSGKTHNSVTLYARSGYEYSCDGVTWQSSNVFTGFEAETNYMFYQRKAETAYYYASEASSALTVKTDEAPSYTIGDIDGDQAVTQDDAVYLLLNTMFGEAFYPLNGAPADIDNNGEVNQEDAIYLLLHTMFGETFYPLNTMALPAKTEE